MPTHAAHRGQSRRALTTLLLAGLTALAGCGGDPPEVPVRSVTPSGTWTAPSAADAAARDEALVRVVSAIPGASRFDLFAGRQKVADALEYRTVTPYMSIPAERQSFRVLPAGLDTAEPLAELAHGVDAGNHYTVVIMPGEEGARAAAVRVFEDPNDIPEGDRATLRIIHAAPDAGRVDAVQPGRAEPLINGLTFQEASPFQALPAAPGTIEVRPVGRTETMLRVPGVQLAAGGMYTAILIGRTRIDPPLEALVIEDRQAGMPPQ